ncbi:sigma-54-dependent Fis family transcriptional regulator, partial [bacterium]|nr:sigma-54-dependent Fis family transcriptional regulator [bacterium]
MPRKIQLLVVDDDEDFSRDFAVLSRDLFDITLASTGEEALLLLDEDVPDAVILDLRLGSGIDGLQTLRKIRSTHFDLPVIMVTQYATVETAVEAMKLGAFHYISKHPNMKELYAIIERELRNAGWKSLFLEEVHKQYGEMVGKSSAMKKIYRLISRAAPTSINILIEGENGTGKELVAREIHARSGRAQHPFVAVNCAAIPATLFESVLFGHEKGAFTNAMRRMVGKFETAEKGTIFLDEVSTLTQDLQA